VAAVPSRVCGNGVFQGRCSAKLMLEQHCICATALPPRLRTGVVSGTVWGGGCRVSRRAPAEGGQVGRQSFIRTGRPAPRQGVDAGGVDRRRRLSRGTQLCCRGAACRAAGTRRPAVAATDPRRAVARAQPADCRSAARRAGRACARAAVSAAAADPARARGARSAARRQVAPGGHQAPASGAAERRLTRPYSCPMAAHHQALVLFTSPRLAVWVRAAC